MCSISVRQAAACLPVSQSVSLSVFLGSPGAPRQSCSRPSTFPGTSPSSCRGRIASCRGDSRWQLERKNKTTKYRVCVCAWKTKKKLPPWRNVCFQPGTGPERGAEPSRSRGGAAAGRRDIAAADRLRHPGLGRNAQSGPVSPLSLQPRQTPFKKPQILNPRGARRCEALIFFLRRQPIRKRPVRRGS